MIRRVLKKAGGEVVGIHGAAYILAMFAILSVAMALIRDRLLTHHFGAGIDLDIYYSAFRIPDLLYAFVASMVSVFVLVPFLTKLNTKAERVRFINTLLAVFGFLLIVSASLAYVLMPLLIHTLFPELTLRGYGTELITVTRILLIQPILLGLSSIVSSVIQFKKRYFVFAAVSVMYNLGIILGIIFLVPWFGIYGVVFGVLLGALLHIAIQIPSFLVLGYRPGLDFVPIKDIYKVIVTSVPRSFALIANNITLFALVVIAGTLPVGSVAVLNLARNLQAAPLSIVGASYSAAAFPTLAILFSQNKHKQFIEQIISATRHIIFWSLPITALVIVLRAQIVRIVYGSGAFDWNSTKLVAAALALFIISLATQSITLVFVRGYYAASKTIKPLVFTAINTILTIVLSLIFLHIYNTNFYISSIFDELLRAEGAGSTSVLLLPFAFTVSSLITTSIIVITFIYEFGGTLRPLLRTILQVSIASIVLATMTYLSLQLITHFIIIDNTLSLLWQGAVSAIVGLVAWAGTLYLLHNKEAISILGVIQNKLTRQKRVLTDITPE